MFQRDQENMYQYPPQYGIAANRDLEEKSKAAGGFAKLAAEGVKGEENEQPTEEAIR